MSMFRRPGEDSSSSSSSEEDEQTQDEETSVSNQDSVLSRIQTLESAASGSSSTRANPPRMDIRQSSAQNVRDLMLHALLEDKAMNEAAQQLGKDVSDPEVQRRGREAYQEIARQISNNVDSTYASEELRSHRATAQAGINKLTKSNLSRLAVVPEGVTQALVTRPPQNMTMNIPPQPSTSFEYMSGISAPIELHLRGYPGLQTDRYAREFSQLDVVGKGGYGKVYKAKHKLDGTIYAVKRIPISPAKLARVQEHGPQELEGMLEEVRSLARFEHMNVVRYHNAWLEFTTMATQDSTQPVFTLRNDRLLEDASSAHTTSASIEIAQRRFNDLSFGDSNRSNEDSYGAGIVFEDSDNVVSSSLPRTDTDNHSFRSQLRKSSKFRNRRGSQASQATVATISSTKSRMSAVEDVDEEEEEEIELIPRYTQEKSADTTEDMISHSDVPAQLVPVPDSGPVLTLNVQMSLCESNLATFLSAEHFSNANHPDQRHCFHPHISLDYLRHIVSGVEYLHAKGVVHRDLKPANVFLSFSDARHAPYGSVNVSTCKPCTTRTCLHVTPRIGDFGLVAALNDTCAAPNNGVKPVGTEFYRPEYSHKINEKLDVFALGIIGFELMQKFGTRMERIAALTELRQGRFPQAFSSQLGPIGTRVQQLISDMVVVDEYKRLGCDEVQQRIEQILKMA